MDGHGLRWASKVRQLRFIGKIDNGDLPLAIAHWEYLTLENDWDEPAADRQSGERVADEMLWKLPAPGNGVWADHRLHGFVETKKETRKAPCHHPGGITSLE